MPKYLVVFERPARVWCRGSIDIDAATEEEAQNLAEEAMMQGRIALDPTDELEFDKDHAATIALTEEY